MARNKHTTDPSAPSVRVWAIERRYRRNGCRWWVFDTYREDFPEYQLVCECERRSQERIDYEFRYRAATLTFDDDGRGATIY